MRTWRVGTISMGISLVILGIILLLSRVFGLDLYNVMISWWPVILMVLGVEILIYLFFQKKETAVIKYDFFSIIIIGMLGTVGIAFFIVSSVGIVDEVSAAITSREETRDLPELREVVQSDVERIVLEVAEWNSLTLEGGSTHDLSVFGTYRTNVSDRENIIERIDQYATLKQVGDTLYLTIKRLPQKTGFNYHFPAVTGTIIVPEHLLVEVRAANSNLVLRPREMKADWLLERAGNVSVHLSEGSDVIVEAIEVHQLEGRNIEWEVSEADVSNNEEMSSSLDHGSVQFGKGTSKIKVLNAYQVTVYPY